MVKAALLAVREGSDIRALHISCKRIPNVDGLLPHEYTELEQKGKDMAAKIFATRLPKIFAHSPCVSPNCMSPLRAPESPTRSHQCCQNSERSRFG